MTEIGTCGAVTPAFIEARAKRYFKGRKIKPTKAVMDIFCDAYNDGQNNGVEYQKGIELFQRRSNISNHADTTVYGPITASNAWGDFEELAARVKKLEELTAGVEPPLPSRVVRGLCKDINTLDSTTKSIDGAVTSMRQDLDRLWDRTNELGNRLRKHYHRVHDKKGNPVMVLDSENAENKQ